MKMFAWKVPSVPLIFCFLININVRLSLGNGVLKVGLFSQSEMLATVLTLQKCFPLRMLVRQAGNSQRACVRESVFFTSGAR